jgi:hypothetical protein
VVPEFVLLDYVLGDLELLDGVRVMPEASILTLTAQSAGESSYWSVDDRMAPGAESSATDVCDILSSELERLLPLRRLWIGLTAGRDSRLVAAGLHRRGGIASAFTMGGGSIDAAGASEVCSEFGWNHEVLTGYPWAPSWSRAVAATAWTDGAQISRDLLNAPLAWPFENGSCAIWGSGGETGRAFYWTNAEADNARDAFRNRSAALAFSAAAAQSWKDRSEAELDSATAWAGGDPLRALDVVYARGRMRKWLARGLQAPALLGTLTAFTSPAMTRALMDLPRAARNNSTAFDEALRMFGQPPAQNVSTPAAARRPQSRLAQKWGTREGAVESAIRDRGAAPQFVVDHLGSKWWSRMRRHAGENASIALKAWNALSVQALADLLDELP